MFKPGLPGVTLKLYIRLAAPLVASGRVLVLTESLIPNPPRFTPTAPSQSLLPTHLPLSAIAGFFPRASSHLSVELQLSLLIAGFEFQT